MSRRAPRQPKEQTRIVDSGLMFSSRNLFFYAKDANRDVFVSLVFPGEGSAREAWRGVRRFDICALIVGDGGQADLDVRTPLCLVSFILRYAVRDACLFECMCVVSTCSASRLLFFPPARSCPGPSPTSVAEAALSLSGVSERQSQLRKYATLQQVLVLLFFSQLALSRTEGNT